MALFSKRHYAYLESIFRDETRIAKLTGSAERIDQQQMIVARLAQALSNDNPAFDADQFFVCCDLPQLAQQGKTQIIKAVAKSNNLEVCYPKQRLDSAMLNRFIPSSNLSQDEE